MKRLICVALMAAAASQAQAAEFGVGVSVQSDDSWIYVPIDLTPSFRLEPSVRYRDGKSESVNPDSFLGSQITTTVTSDSKTYELGLGIFGLKQVGESVRVYFGGRIAYIDSESKVRIVTDFGNFDDEDMQDASDDGYRISPTLGFEYSFNRNVSIGAEAEWFYQDIDSTLTTTNESMDGEFESTGTDTRLIVRFKF